MFSPKHNDFLVTYHPRPIRRYTTPRGRRPAAAALRSQDLGAVVARVAAVRARVGDNDELPSHIADERGDATLYRLRGSSRCRGGSACESYPRRRHTMDSPIRDREAAHPQADHCGVSIDI
ncbi:hypothetical protein E3N88_02792 [Mikania micrantha]|uniref:Uncharacterized protein n=1 Tax=Mikania micrantha TaxID=192012 RepID=A0A5N6Q6J8_9ASTR|nr:hypothetical protein E3N88_02792 [Mikania micrantha]